MLSRPSSLGDLIRQSGGLRATSRHSRLSARSLTFKGSSCPSSSPSGLSLLHSRGSPPSVRRGPNTCTSGLPYRHWTSGRDPGSPWHPTSPLEPASCGQPSRRLFQQLNSESDRGHHNLVDKLSGSTRTRKCRRGLCPRICRQQPETDQSATPEFSPRPVVRRPAPIATCCLPSSSPRQQGLRVRSLSSRSQGCLVLGPRDGWRIRTIVDDAPRIETDDAHARTPRIPTRDGADALSPAAPDTTLEELAGVILRRYGGLPRNVRMQPGDVPELSGA